MAVAATAAAEEAVDGGGGTVPGNSGSRSGTGGGKRLSRWLLVAHWRCTEAFDLSLSPSAHRLSPSLSARLRAIFLRLIFRFLLSSRLSHPSLSLEPLSASLLHGSSSSSPPPPPPPLHRVNLYTHTHTCPQESAPPSTLSTLCLLVWFRSRSPLPLAIPRSRPPRRFPSFSPFILLFPCRRRPGDVAACYDLHSSRNKTFATTPADDKRNCALSVLYPPTYPPLKVMP